jgi:hypothetical protein
MGELAGAAAVVATLISLEPGNQIERLRLLEIAGSSITSERQVVRCG